MKLDRDALYQIYAQWVDKVSDDIPEKNFFYPSEIVNAICNIIESNPSLIEIPSDEEIVKEANKYKFQLNQTFFIEGGKWMKEQILNQNTLKYKVQQSIKNNKIDLDKQIDNQIEKELNT